MDSQNIPPTKEMVEAQVAKWQAIGRGIAWGSFLLAVFFGLVIYLAQDTLKTTAPALLFFFEACVVILVAGGIIGLFKSRHDLHKAKLERYRHNTYRFPVDFNGNYEAFLDQQAKTFLQPTPGNMQVPVPQTYAPHLSYSYEYKDSSQRMLEESATDAPFQANLAPTIEEVVEALPRNGFQICLGRSLTTGELLPPIDLPDNHMKIIGATRKGKSCEAAAILEQVQRSHDPNTLQFALLDLEYKTSRLFERSSHVAYVQAGRRGKVPAIARSAEEVALWLRYLREEMDRRYKMTPQQKAQLPYILVYLEEFLDLRRRLKGEVLADAIDNFTSLATRSLKEKMGLMVCAQVDYSDEDLRDAMAQFVGANLAFSVRPNAARAAGFLSTDLLNKNYATKIPGQFVVEATGITDLGVSPQYDVKQKLATLDGAHDTQEIPALVSPEVRVQANAEEVQTSFVHQVPPNWQAHLEPVWDLWKAGVRSQEQIIENIWGVKKGGNEKWYAYRAIVQQCLAEIKWHEASSLPTTESENQS